MLATAERRTIYYAGRVQGVGFRYTTRNFAARLPVTGYVQNLPDGRVLLVAEGPREGLDRLVALVEEEMGPYITSREQATSPARDEFDDFEIRF